MKMSSSLGLLSVMSILGAIIFLTFISNEALHFIVSVLHYCLGYNPLNEVIHGVDGAFLCVCVFRIWALVILIDVPGVERFLCHDRNV